MTSSNGFKTQKTQFQDDEEEQQEEKQDRLDFDKADFSFIPKGNHGWRQEGPYLVCYQCELTHAVFIGMEKVMIGIDEKGDPILRAKTGLQRGGPS